MLTDTRLEELVNTNHPYRRIDELLELGPMVDKFIGLYAKVGRRGIALDKALKMLLLQFMEDYSDRQMQKALEENLAVKWFCGFELKESTPDHSYFGKFRKRLGTESVAELFNYVVEQLKSRGLVGQVFTFIDSTALITKTALWEERDRAIAQGEEGLNNKTVKNYSADKDARFGCKGKSKFWYGYKRHVSVDMKQGLVTKVAMTPANVSDSKAARHVCPQGGMVLADKAYGEGDAPSTFKRRGCHSGAILKKNRKEKDWDKDRWLTTLRMPYEGVFARMAKRARYRGQAKVQMQGFLEATVYNLKRWAKIESLRIQECALI